MADAADDMKLKLKSFMLMMIELAALHNLRCLLQLPTLLKPFAKRMHKLYLEHVG